MRRRKVCVDLNQVLVDTSRGLCQRLKSDLGILVPTKRFEGKDAVKQVFPNVVPGSGPKRLEPEDYTAAKGRMFDTDAFLSVPAVPGAAEAVTKLIAVGYEVTVVTDAKTVRRDRVARWLTEHRFPKLDVIFTRSIRPKAPHQCRCDIVIDNEIEQLEPLLEGEGQPLLIHFLPEPNASGCDLATPPVNPRILTMRGWPEVLGHLLALTDEESFAA
ncbi:MAG TPA: hypothetical protein VGE53_03135 [Candidatus Paceibacterota bacterium]